MSDAVYMDFEEPEDRPRAPKAPAGKPKKGKKKGDEQKKAVIPSLPKPEPVSTGDEVRSGVSDRNRAATKLKVQGYSYLEIADLLEFKDAKAARSAVEGVLSATLAPEEIEMTRALVVSRAEEQFKQSVAMGHADFLVTEDGERVPNQDKLRWHQQASEDLMKIALYTGAKAPTKVEFSPGEAEMERLVSAFVQRAGVEDIVDAEVIELDNIPRLEIESSEDDDDDEVIEG